MEPICTVGQSWQVEPFLKKSKLHAEYVLLLHECHPQHLHAQEKKKVKLTKETEEKVK